MALVIFAIITMIVAPIIRGLVLSIMWGWFIVPLGVPAIGIAGAIGVAMLIAMITHEDAQTTERSIEEAFGVALLSPFLVLLIAWIVHMFM